MNRRDFLKLIVSIPVLGAAALFVSPLFRYLRPSSGPLLETGLSTTSEAGDPLPPTEWQGSSGLAAPPDMPEALRQVRFNLAEFPGDWSVRTFTFGQKAKEYTFKHFQATNIPGFAVRLPDNVELPEQIAQGHPAGAPKFIVVSRICTHMGCVFNFIPDPAELSAYNYPTADNPHFACPCHLSVFDPTQQQNIGPRNLLGKVVSGPAPRPPRQFTWEIRGEELWITEAEAGGIS